MLYPLGLQLRVTLNLLIEQVVTHPPLSLLPLSLLVQQCALSLLEIPDLHLLLGLIVLPHFAVTLFLDFEVLLQGQLGKDKVDVERFLKASFSSLIVFLTVELHDLDVVLEVTLVSLVLFQVLVRGELRNHVSQKMLCQVSEVVFGVEVPDDL